MGLVTTCDRCGAQSGAFADYDKQPCRGCLERELEQHRAIVAKLPKTADGVPVVPGMMVWTFRGHIPGLATGDVCGPSVIGSVYGSYQIEGGEDGNIEVWRLGVNFCERRRARNEQRVGAALDECYSTLKAAKAARKEPT